MHMMKGSVYSKLQKKFGGQWISTSQKGNKVYAVAKKVDDLFNLLRKKNIAPQKTTIGYIEKYGQISVYISLSTKTN